MTDSPATQSVPKVSELTNRMVSFAKGMLEAGMTVDQVRSELHLCQTSYGDHYTNSSVEEWLGEAVRVHKMSQLSGDGGEA